MKLLLLLLFFFFYFTVYLFSYHKAIIQNEVESVRKHIETVDNFWGRPGLIIIFQIIWRNKNNFMHFHNRLWCTKENQNQIKIE